MQSSAMGAGLYLRNANLVGADLHGADLSNADLTGADLDFVRGVGLADCPASLPIGWACVRNNLVGPNANLAGVNLSGADLRGVDLSGAYLIGADLSGAELVDEVWSYTRCPDTTISATKGSSPESCCANLNGAVPDFCSP